MAVFETKGRRFDHFCRCWLESVWFVSRNRKYCQLRDRLDCVLLFRAGLFAIDLVHSSEKTDYFIWFFTLRINIEPVSTFDDSSIIIVWLVTQRNEAFFPPQDYKTSNDWLFVTLAWDPPPPLPIRSCRRVQIRITFKRWTSPMFYALAEVTACIHRIFIVVRNCTPRTTAGDLLKLASTPLVGETLNFVCLVYKHAQPFEDSGRNFGRDN